MFVACLQWLWSVKNVCAGAGPLRSDFGVVSWAVLVYSRYLQNSFLSFLICVFQVCAFGFVLGFIVKSKPWQNDFARLARKYDKSKTWAKMFVAYMAGHSLFWAICAREFYLQWMSE